MNLTYKRATLEDIDILVKTRIEVLKAANKLCVDTDMGEVERQSYSYYQKALCDGSHIAYLVFNGSCCIGTGGVSFFQELIALVTSTAMLQKKNCTTNFCFALFLSIFRLFFIPF